MAEESLHGRCGTTVAMEKSLVHKSQLSSIRRVLCIGAHGNEENISCGGNILKTNQLQNHRNPRRLGVDVARGLCLLIMTADHLPRCILHRFSNTMFGPFGFFTAASGFVFLSGVASYWVYSFMLREQDAIAAWRRVFRRAVCLYSANSILFLLVFMALRSHILSGDQWQAEFPMIFSHPYKALCQGLLLLYRPGYLDILPMYILFVIMLLPALMAIRAGWLWAVNSISLCIWLLVQVYSPRELNALNPLAYQLLFVSGLAIGSIDNVKAKLLIPRALPLFKAIISFSAILLLLRLSVGIFHYIRMDSALWHRLVSLENNGPIRVANFVLFTISACYLWWKIPVKLKTSPFMRWLAFLGQHSLPVFIWSILATYVSMALMTSETTRIWRMMDLILTVTSLVIPAYLHKLLQEGRKRSIRYALHNAVVFHRAGKRATNRLAVLGARASRPPI
jgi:hypothetical protein